MVALLLSSSSATYTSTASRHTAERQVTFSHDVSWWFALGPSTF